jgi:hypothetical protein
MKWASSGSSSFSARSRSRKILGVKQRLLAKQRATVPVRGQKRLEGVNELAIAAVVDPTLGGLVFGITYGRPEPAIEAVAGAPAIKSATLSVTVDYETDAPLS